MSSDPNFEYSKKVFIKIVKSYGIPFGKPYISDLRVSFKVRAKQPDRICLVKEGNKTRIYFVLAKGNEIKNSIFHPRYKCEYKDITDVESEKATIFEYLRRYESRIRAELGVDTAKSHKHESGFAINEKDDFSMAEEVSGNETLVEGARHQITVNAYERNSKARIKCIKHYGAKCIVCDFNFYDRYGDAGKGFIHVHHIVPLNEIDNEYKVDPISDLIPVCPNCHAIIHRKKPAYTIEEIKKLIKQE